MDNSTKSRIKLVVVAVDKEVVGVVEENLVVARAQESVVFRIHMPLVAEEIGIVSVSLQACFVGKVGIKIVPTFLVGCHGRVSRIVWFFTVGKLGNEILADRNKV